MTSATTGVDIGISSFSSPTNKITFKLNSQFIEKYKSIQPPFGFNGLGELVYMRTYNRLKKDGTNERWFETIERVVNGIYTIQKEHIISHRLGWDENKAQRSAQEMYDRMFWMKFLGSGRGLWALGTPIIHEKKLGQALNNCLAYETKILTDTGYYSIGEIAENEGEAIILTKNGKWIKSKVKCFGEQELLKITLQRQNINKTIYATPNHIWFAKNEYEYNRKKPFSEYYTKDLKNGFRLQYLFGQTQINYSPQGIQHGLCFGDGTNDHLYLCGQEKRQLAEWFPTNIQTIDNTKDAIRVAHLPTFYKDLPDIRWDKKYLLGWLMGYFAADGSIIKQGQITLSSSNKENLIFVNNVCGILGIGTYDIRLSSTKSNFKEDRKLYTICLMSETLAEDFFLNQKHKNRFRKTERKPYWAVKSVEQTNRFENVYCAEVLDTHSFVIEGNILTHNCAFRTTQDITENFTEPFCFMMDFSMSGVGCGFDTRGAYTVKIIGPDNHKSIQNITIEDSREGWVDSVRVLLNSYAYNTSPVSFDYSEIRPEGSPIKTFGGLAPGPRPLIELHDNLRAILNNRIDHYVTERDIVDIMNFIGKCVVSGNVRRSAQLVLGNPNSDEFLDLKNYEINSDRIKYGWLSNNSILAKLGMDYNHIVKRTIVNGEPGFVWLDNCQRYGRMGDYPNDKDAKVAGVNPCSEITLEGEGELCNLIESFPNRHEDLEDFKRTLKFAYLYGKTVSLVGTTNEKTNQIVWRNRRIGCSMSGIAQFITYKGIDELKTWCEEGYKTIKYYDRKYSEWFGIPQSIKVTTIKPSGTLSLLCHSTPGMHYPESRFYIRRLRLAKNSELVSVLIDAGYKIEPALGNEETTVIVEVPIDCGEKIKSASEVSMWEQLSLAAFLQKYWADNSVSVTVTFDPETEGHQIENALNFFQYQLKAVSFLPRPKNSTPYEQMPYESISKETYNKMASKLQPPNFQSLNGKDAEPERYCDSDKCSIL